jgi:heavy metal sensor kinase
MKTFRMRIALVFTVCLAIPVILLARVVYMEHQKQLLKTIEWTLVQEAKATAERLQYPAGLESNQELIKKVNGDYSLMVKRGKRLVMGSMNSIDDRWPVNADKLNAAMSGTLQFDTVVVRGERVMILYYPLERDNVLRLGKSLDDVNRYLSGLKGYATFFPIVAVAISFLIGWLIAGLAVRPINTIRNRVSEIMQQKTSQTIPLQRAGSEVQGLVMVINRLLGELRGSLDIHKRFTSDLSHEIRSPLTSLIGNTEVALRKKRSQEEYESLLRDNLVELVRLSRITDNILFLTKADSHLLELRKQRFDVSQLISSVVERFRYRSQRAGVNLVEEHQEGLAVFGDLNLLEQAFSNLVDNAVKYTPAGGSVIVRTERLGDEVIVSVQDTGHGIPEIELPHIFDRFYRAETGQAVKAGGTGLGLSITRWIVEANNGTVEAMSTVGAGTEFMVKLPAEERSGR